MERVRLKKSDKKTTSAKSKSSDSSSRKASASSESSNQSSSRERLDPKKAIDIETQHQVGRKPVAKHADKVRLAAWARLYAQDALTTLLSICKNEQEQASARISAAKEILDRGYGKPTQGHELSTPEGPLRIKLDQELLQSLPENMLQSLLVLVSALEKGSLEDIQTNTPDADAGNYESTLH